MITSLDTTNWQQMGAPVGAIAGTIFYCTAVCADPQNGTGVLVGVGVSVGSGVLVAVGTGVGLPEPAGRTTQLSDTEPFVPSPGRNART